MKDKKQLIYLHGNSFGSCELCDIDYGTMITWKYENESKIFIRTICLNCADPEYMQLIKDLNGTIIKIETKIKEYENC